MRESDCLNDDVGDAGDDKAKLQRKFTLQFPEALFLQAQQTAQCSASFLSN